MRKESFWHPLVQKWAAGAVAAASLFAWNVVGTKSYAQEPVAVAEAAEAPAEEEEAEEEEEKPDYFTLMGAMEGTYLGNFLECNNTKIYGNVAQGMTFNMDSPSDRFNGPMTWIDRDKEWGLQQAWFGVAKTVNQDDCCWDWGYQVNAMYGTSYRWAIQQGFENQLNNGQSFYGLALPDMNVKLGNQDWLFTVGRFVSPVGYNTVDTTANFFPIIPFTYQYGEMFTQTGAMAAYKLSDRITVTSGVTRGWDNWDGTNFGSPNLGALGMVAIAGQNAGDSLTWFGHWSREANERTTPGGGPGVSNDFSGRYIQSLVYIKKLSEQSTWVLQSDFGHQDRAKLNGASANWFGVNSYLFHKYNDCWTWGLNTEWFRDDGGYRVGTLLPAYPGSEARGLGGFNGNFRGGYNGDFFRVMFGPQWSPRTNLVMRPGLAVDWFSGSIDANKQRAFGNANNPGLRPYNDGTSNVQGVAFFDVFFKF